LIGIIAKKTEKEIVQEFFELFKTPWEFYNQNRYYDVVISTGDYSPNIETKLLIIYGSGVTQYDIDNNIITGPKKKEVMIEYNDCIAPIFKKIITFDDSYKSILSIHKSKEADLLSAGLEIDKKNRTIIYSYSRNTHINT